MWFGVGLGDVVFWQVKVQLCQYFVGSGGIGGGIWYGLGFVCCVFGVWFMVGWYQVFFDVGQVGKVVGGVDEFLCGVFVEGDDFYLFVMFL